MSYCYFYYGFMMRLRLLPMMLVSALLSQGALNHSEQDNARFVTAHGQDLGVSDNRRRPCRAIAHTVNLTNKSDKVLVAYPLSCS